MDFHHLLLGCLILYAKTLHSLRKTHSHSTGTNTIPKADPPQGTKAADVVACFDKLTFVNRLLVLILSSHSFITHLKIMAGTSALVPSSQCMAIYNNFELVVIMGSKGSGGGSSSYVDDIIDNKDDEQKLENQVHNT
jgi:hypothetical protein